MARYFVRRIVQSIFVLFIVSIICFALIHLAPGSPFTELLPNVEERQRIQAHIHSLGFDQPIVLQYFRWILQMMHGDFGYTELGHSPVLKVLWPYIQHTFLLMGVSWLLALCIAVPWAMRNSMRPHTASDKIASALAYVGFGIPAFWLGMIFQVIFSFELFWLPPSSMYDAGSYGDLGNLLQHMVMPVSVLTLSFLLGYLKYTQNSLVEVLPADYIRTARAKGSSEFRVLVRHAFRNALIPLITVIGLDFPGLLGGAALVETVFHWPGIGSLVVHSVNAREYSTLMAIVVLSAIMVVIGNLAADLLYAIVDPRVKIGPNAS